MKVVIIFAKASGRSFLFCLCLAGGAAWAQDFSDSFAGRELFENSFVLTGSNTLATLEPFEPQHARKTGGHSVWLSWLAPDNGLVTLTTAGSTFDTLLAVYVLDPGNDPPLERLEEIASNDDDGLLKTSALQFGAQSNQTYEIAVDGFNGAVGEISFQLDFLSSTNILPTVLRRPGDQALRLNDPLILTLGIVPSKNLELKWHLNGNPVFDAEEPTLVIPHLQRTNLGFYTIKLTVGDNSFFSAPVEIQVNSEGVSNVLAHNKIADAAASGINSTSSVGGNTLLAFISSTGVARGYNGTQIYNTVYATIDTNEPPHCGVAGGASYWFSYQAPAGGTMTVDTEGSSFDTVLAIYTYNGVLNDYTNLISITCDNNSGTNGQTSWVQFITQNARNYFIVVDGVNGARGIAHINYSLVTGTNVAPVSPFITSQPQALTVSQHTAVSLGVLANGTAPFNYQWRRNNSTLNAQTNATILLSDPQSQDAGNYTVIVTNIAGASTSSPAKVMVISSPLLSLNTASGALVSGFPATRGYQYYVDCGSQPTAPSWWHWITAFADYGGVIWVTNSTKNNNSMFLRVYKP